MTLESFIGVRNMLGNIRVTVWSSSNADREQLDCFDLSSFKQIKEHIEFPDAYKVFAVHAINDTLCILVTNEF
jgi:hypothetical protein